MITPQLTPTLWGPRKQGSQKGSHLCQFQLHNEKKKNQKGQKKELPDASVNLKFKGDKDNKGYSMLATMSDTINQSSNNIGLVQSNYFHLVTILLFTKRRLISLNGQCNFRFIRGSDNTTFNISD